MRMVEKMAKAILAKVPEGYGMTEAEAVEYARASLEAARDPDVLMIVAGGEHTLKKLSDMGPSICGPSLAHACFTAMIDKAIQESGE